MQSIVVSQWIQVSKHQSPANTIILKASQYRNVTGRTAENIKVSDKERYNL